MLQLLPMESAFKDKAIVVTGGRGALGSAIVDLLTQRGASCWVPTSRAPAKEREKVTYIGPVDLSSPDDVNRFYGDLPPIWASIHVAGGFAMASIEDTDFSDFERMWRMNTVSSFLSCQAAIANFRKSGQGGRIVNVAARPAVEPVGGMLAYTTSKAGVASLTQCLAKEVAKEGILVNAILPAIIDTPANRSAMPDADHESWPTTVQIAHTVAALVSPQNTLTTGNLVPVYGKMT